MRYVALMLVVAAMACGGGNPENTFVCGLESTVGANMVLDQLRTGAKVLTEPPPDMAGRIPVRVVGYGTSPGLVAEGPDGAIVGYEGEGFPPEPGFGLALVEDSADVFQGILIYEIRPPSGYPELGIVAAGEHAIPLFGLRVTWAAVSSARCPLFGPLGEDDTSTPETG